MLIETEVSLSTPSKSDFELSVSSITQSSNTRSSVPDKSHVSVSENVDGPPGQRFFKVPDIFTMEDAVEAYLEGLALQNSGLTVLRESNTLLRKDHKLLQGRVKLLTGGPAMQEPLHTGIVGKGGITAAVLGSLTSNPPYMNILKALRVLSQSHTESILVIVMNSLSNRLNFGLACQQAAHEGIKTMCLTVGEDCSGINIDKTVGKHGLCGIVFLLKIAGAMAENGMSLYEMFCIITALKGGSLGTINVEQQENSMYVRAGLKGESGECIGNVDSLSDVVRNALFYILNPASYFSLHVLKGDDVAVIVNSGDYLSHLHLTLIVREVIRQISFLGLNVARVYSGRFLPSQAPAAFSVSVLKVKSDILKWLDWPVNAMCWPVKVTTSTETQTDSKELVADKIVPTSTEDFSVFFSEKNLGPKFTFEQSTMVVFMLQSVVKAILNLEEELNALDLDGDYGTTLKAYMNRIQNQMDDSTLIIITPFGLLNNLAELAALSMGGLSGAVFSVLFSSAAQAFVSSSSYTKGTWSLWVDAARMARDGLCAYSNVRPGNRTILDAIYPFVETFTVPSLECLTDAVRSAWRGAQETEGMAHGRQDRRCMDAGAYALAVALQALLDVLVKGITDTEHKTDLGGSSTKL